MWQSNKIGELESERDHYQAIAQACATDREQERRLSITAADDREREQAALERELAGQKFDTRNIIEGGRGDCLSADSPLGSRIVDAEKQSTDNINGIWLPSAGSPDD